MAMTNWADRRVIENKRFSQMGDYGKREFNYGDYERFEIMYSVHNLWFDMLGCRLYPREYM